MGKTRRSSSVSQAPSDEELKETARVLGLLGHRTRLRVLYALSAAERTSGELCELTGETQIMFNHHLSLIRAAGLVETKKEGRFVRYSLSGLGQAAVAAAEAIAASER